MDPYFSSSSLTLLLGGYAYASGLEFSDLHILHTVITCQAEKTALEYVKFLNMQLMHPFFRLYTFFFNFEQRTIGSGQHKKLRTGVQGKEFCGRPEKIPE